MSSNEEYLDDLLKTIMDGKSDAGEDTQSAQVTGDGGISEESPDKEKASSTAGDDVNKAMTTEDLEEMFASMNMDKTEKTSSVVENAAAEDVPDRDVLDDWPPRREAVIRGGMSGEEMLSDYETPVRKAVIRGGISDEELLEDYDVPVKKAVFKGGMPDEEEADYTSARTEAFSDEMPDAAIDGAAGGIPEAMADELSGGMAEGEPGAAPDISLDDLLAIEEQDMDAMPETAPEGIADELAGEMPDGIPDIAIEDVPDGLLDIAIEDVPDGLPDIAIEDMPDGIPDAAIDDVVSGIPEAMTDELSGGMAEGEPGAADISLDDLLAIEEPDMDAVPETAPEGMAEEMPEGLPDIAIEDMPDGIPDAAIEDIMSGLPEDMADELSGGMAAEESGASPDVSLDDLLAIEEPDMDAMPDEMPDVALEDAMDGILEEASDGIPNAIIDEVLGETPDSISEEMPEGVLEEESSEVSLDDLMALEEPELTGEMSEEALEGIIEEGMPESEGAVDDVSLDDLLAMGESEFSGDELALTESSDDGQSDDATMSEDEIERLLSGEALEDSAEPAAESMDDLALTDDFALTEDGADGDGDLSDLLAGLDQSDDLAEINDLLEKSDQGIPVDDDMLAMLENVPGEEGDLSDLLAGEDAGAGSGSADENASEEGESAESKKERKKREKKEKKEKKKKNKKGKADSGETEGEQSVDESDVTLESLLGNAGEGAAEEEPKKQGAFSRFLAFLTETDEEELEDADGNEELPTGNMSEENKEVLAELNAEDKKNAKKKNKKEKGKKDKKGAKEGEAAEGEEGEEAAKKPKKEKKKKKKEEDPEEAFKAPEKKLSKKKVISVFLFCGTIAACIILACMILPDYMQKSDARAAYDHQNYEETYELLYGKKLDDADAALFEKSNIILQMRHKLDSYAVYKRLDNRLEALNVLMQGVERYYVLLPSAEEYRVSEEIRVTYEQILAELSSEYGISESEALDIIASGDNITYSQRLEAVVNGVSYGADGEDSNAVQDVLPEEEEIIDRLQGTDEAEDL